MYVLSLSFPLRLAYIPVYICIPKVKIHSAHIYNLGKKIDIPGVVGRKTQRERKREQKRALSFSQVYIAGTVHRG